MSGAADGTRKRGAGAIPLHLSREHGTMQTAIVTRGEARTFLMHFVGGNGIAERQFAGLSSPLARPGRFSHREPLVHAIDNWILDQLDR